MGLVGLIGVGFLGADIVVLQFFLEELQGVVIVLLEVLGRDLGGIVADGAGIAGADLVALDGSAHILVADLIGDGSLQLAVKEVHQLVDAGLGPGGGLIGDQIVAVIAAGAHSLGAVLAEAHNIGGVHGVGAGVDRIQIHIHVEQHVLHGQRMAIGIEDTVLQHEGVGSGVAVFHDLIVLDHHGFVIAVGDLYFTVYILGRQHADLGHTDNGAIGGRGGEEGIEQAIQLIGHDNESVNASAAAAGESGSHSTAQSQAQHQGKNLLTHGISPLHSYHCRP